ncbi:MAG: ABC transporter permease [Candidatus Brennerbacteria bacterium]|nr:ABC transporter permease [Candidatus Brennerbacteria bacterium]
MITTLFRIIKYGVQSFIRNGWLSTATVAVMILALFVFQTLILFGVVAKTAILALQDKIDISVYFKIDAPEDDILKTKRSLEILAEVKKVDYVSRDQALTDFETKHKEDEIVSQALKELESNPLSASLNIKANDPGEYAAIAAYLNNETINAFVDKVSYSQNQTVIEKLVSIVDGAKQSGFIIGLILAGIAVLVTFNTIRLAIYSNREEIGIMRLVGGANYFIRGPYVVEGIFYGVLSAVLSMAIITPLITLVSPYISNFIPGISLQSYFYANFFSLLGYQLIFGIGLGIISSVIAVRRYLRV